jgi:hypothetical protein
MEAVVLSIATGGSVSDLDHTSILDVRAGIILVPPEIEKRSRGLEQVTPKYGVC